MKNITLFLIMIGVIFIYAPSGFGDEEPDGVRFELIVRQKPEALVRYFEIIRDTVDIHDGGNISTFIVNMTLDIDIEAVDSQSVTFSSHLVTVGSSPYNAAKRFRIEYNLPARMENIPGKNGSMYQLLISPRGRITMDNQPCDIDPFGDQFNMDPTANFDLYYMKGSLGDFHWNNIKNYLEADFSRFQSALDMNAPGKISLYLCPCPPDVIDWDKRFGYGIDPGRSALYTIYNHDFKSVDAILPNMLKLLRLWGYAPPFIVEGLAGYFDFTTYNIKKLKDEGGVLKINNLLTTRGYYSADPFAAENCAASFIKYLADIYGIGKVKKWYSRADDLTILKSFEEVYELPLDSLENEWLYYIDTIQFERNIFDYYAARANAIFRTDRQIELMQKMAEYDQTNFDSVDTWKKLSTVYYQYGYYYEAIEGYRRLIAIDSALPLYWQVLGNLNMINGEYDLAVQCFDTVLMLDTSYATAGLSKARIRAIKGDTAAAIEIAENFYNSETSISGKVEFMLFLGEMYAASGKNHDSAKADGYYTDALIWSRDMIPKVQNDPIYQLRAGLALLGLGQYDDARKLLELVEFTEMRTYYLGLTKLNLGKLYDLMGDHERAIEYYRDALSVPLASFHRDLCEQYINKPFSL